MLALAAAWWTWGLSLLLLLGYPLLAWRVYRGRRRRGDSSRAAAVYARFCVLGKFPHAEGQLRYHCRRLLARPSTLIEYKQAAAPPAESEAPLPITAELTSAAPETQPAAAVAESEPALLERTDLSAVSAIRMGSAPVSEGLIEAARRSFPHAVITNGYGTTEAGPIVFTTHANGLPTPDLSVGAAHPDV